MKTKTKIRLLTTSRAAREKRLYDLNQKLEVIYSNMLSGYDEEEMEERAWLKKKLGY